MVLNYIHNYKLEYLVDINPNKSSYESDIEEYVRTLCDNIVLRDKTILNGLELDIYLPDYKLAIEFNGTYWHSSIKKDYKYHYNKTLECAKNNIRLIHIFEYEWVDEKQRNKLKNLIKSALNIYDRKIYARECDIISIDYNTAKPFMIEYHIQNDIKSFEYYGCYYKNELIGLMAFGIPRFNKQYDFELLRLCWKFGVNVVGGSERIFAKFIRDYKPSTIISYCDLSKFNGRIYKKLGFKLVKISNPNYVWVSGHNKDILSRYNTMKKDLIAKGLGTAEDTEDLIMMRQGYFKVYDCGNLVYVYTKQ